MKKLLIVFLFSGLGVFSGAVAQAGAALTGNPYNLYSMWNGALFMWTNRVHSDPTVCGANLRSRFAIDGTTAAGKVQVAALLAAYSMGKKITIQSTETSLVWSDTETVSFFQIID